MIVVLGKVKAISVNVTIALNSRHPDNVMIRGRNKYRITIATLVSTAPNNALQSNALEREYCAEPAWVLSRLRAAVVVSLFTLPAFAVGSLDFR